MLNFYRGAKLFAVTLGSIRWVIAWPSNFICSMCLYIVRFTHQVLANCLKLLCKCHVSSNMGKKSDLTVQEKESITRELSKGSRTLEIAKVLRRDHRTIKKYVAASHRGRKKRVQRKFNKLNDRQLRQIIGKLVVQTPLASSRQICALVICQTLTCNSLQSFEVLEEVHEKITSQTTTQGQKGWIGG